MKIQDIHSQPLIEVGILSREKLDFVLHSSHKVIGYQEDGSERIEYGSVPQGSYSCTCEDGLIQFENKTFASLSFEPESDSGRFSLNNVRIGIEFHWEQELQQCFEGALLIKTENKHLLAINRIALERYLYSVIASEMNAEASTEFLKAHAVISRSWLLAQLGTNIQTEADMEKKADSPPMGSDFRPGQAAAVKPGAHKTKQTDPKGQTERIRWYEREAHTLFDVCADDHCQRYQGILEAETPQVKTALRSTEGMVLCSDEDICDARFSKCCGGLTESFESCWADTKMPYLVSKPDRIPAPDRNTYADLTSFILGNPPSFCNTDNQAVLKQVLKDYDLQTGDFFRWTVSYSVEELSDLFKQRSGLDLGLLSDMEALERGGSGRIVRLKITGSKGSLILGKELEIRRCLSKTHLYSSAFVVEKVLDKQGNVRQFVLHGAGWGHGVGLCQIGAAVMAEQGYTFKQILEHYYPNTQIKKLYGF
ncbi:MAG: SpoIID/LytB domain-containing protein [Bacteroidales bacterium]|nr:SpoIID/LytB domain-containing protein [Bacteroidales bacterium]MDD3431929.1 SpoIID/LytB domain-containing protein [Bacteroidales bacterium]MDD4361480.1 SpoIID/LytB domain-containing protein [Bacteroidales bacterium]MDD4430499.1 SpoIID/LytB domain-containing protein [Bacteroidales bacterium]